MEDGAMHVAFIGLGTMGYPMAGHLARAGHSVAVHNRTAARAQRWTSEFGGSSARTPAAAARAAQIVFACVGADADLREVTLGPGGAFAGMDAGAIFFDCTTTSAEVARELAAEARRRGLHFIDGPVSGGEAGAIRGQLTVMCGAEEAAFEQARPVALAFARAVTRLGPPGSGQLAKMVNQICIAGLVQGLAEGIAFGQAAGLDMPRVLEAIGQGAAQSWQMDNRGATMIEDRFDFGFAVDWMRKDLGLCMAEAGRNGAQLPVAELVDGFYADIQAMGGGRWDTSSLVRRLRRPS
ncbi:MAG: NAD(P)-dependent oxidoreductase [Proteobacteria bacterium]|nr:MAG: NAD(P)-dependent oxidoreductase [Pseudomonadota bacterium]MBC6944065.1 NAD(P)-dependent oxidoreductase [Gammaproteobacteria bacterium]MCE7903272.1 NAD(P)-dependent oxidoreductase [Gammaproteobacteria bacterium PRO9]MCQ3934923.1 oxidoreductase [Gammaproteobacteria bacterium]MDL1880383.1 NAD(P)-dependent oxidoreductase [Gammaproteobacteria bacterium PRO2]